MVAQVEKRIQLTLEHAQSLRLLAQKYDVSEEQIIDQALDIVFGSAEPLDTLIQRVGQIAHAETKAQIGKHTMSPSDESDFKLYLSDIGLLAPKQPQMPAPSLKDRSPIHIQGKPLSETILEERR